MPAYENATSVETRVREALKYRLEEITTDNDYLNDVAAVLDEFPVNPSSVTSFPTIVSLTGSQTRERFDNETLSISLQAMLVVFVDPAGDFIEQSESIKQDIHAMLGSNPGLPGENDAPTCQLALFASTETFGRVADLPLAGQFRGVKVAVDIVWQQKFTDPTVD